MLASPGVVDPRLVVADSFVDISSAIPRGVDSRTETVVRGIRQALLALDDAPRRGIRTIVAHREMEEVLRVSDAQITVLAPATVSDGPVSAGSANDWSIVLRIEWRGHVLLLTGDATAKTFQEIGADETCNHDTCKVPHHGSRGSLHQAWTGIVGESQRDRSWLVTPYSSCALPRMGETVEPPSSTLTDFVAEVRLTSLPVADSFRVEAPADLTAAQYQTAVDQRKAGTADLAVGGDSDRHWTDAAWWVEIADDELPAMVGRGRSTILISA
jgi:hypothetical protein